MKKIVLNQIGVSPILMLLFYPCIAFFDGRPMGQAFEELKSKYWALLALNYKVWLPASLINFAFIPIQYQVLWANLVNLGWIAIVSFFANSK